MVRFFELVVEALSDFAQLIANWWAEAVSQGHLDPRGWPPLVWALLGLLLLLVLVLRTVARGKRGQRSARAAHPELLISHGQLLLSEGADPAGGTLAPGDALFKLSLTLSNLDPWPVQLLELAVQTRGSAEPVIAEASAVVPPQGAVDVAADLYDLPGDSGFIDFYVYTTQGGRRTYKLSAPLDWEPWAQRYKIRSLSAKLTQTNQLASEERTQLERRKHASKVAAERRRGLWEQVKGAWSNLVARLRPEAGKRWDGQHEGGDRRAAGVEEQGEWVTWVSLETADTAEVPEVQPAPEVPEERVPLEFPDEF